MDGSGPDTALNVLTHHGVMGMKWHEHLKETEKEPSTKEGPSKPSKLDKKIAHHEQQLAINQAKMKHLQGHYVDLHNTGFQAPLMQKEYGKAANLSDMKFALLMGKSKAQALNEKTLEVGRLYYNESQSAKHHEKVLGKLKASREANHSDLTPDDTLYHHGVLGMKWHQHKAGSEPEHPASPDHVVAQHLRDQAKSSGVKSLSSADLKKLNDRLQLEANHSRLVNEGPSKFKKGDDLIKNVINGVNTFNNAHNAVTTVTKNINQIRKLAE